MGPTRFSSVAFAVFSDKPGPKYAEAFASALKSTLDTRRIEGGVFLRNHPENDEHFLTRAGKDADCVIVVRPVGGLQARDSRGFWIIDYVFGALAPVEGGFKVSWEAEVTFKGGTLLKRYDEMAAALLDRMLNDGVIRAPN